MKASAGPKSDVAFPSGCKLDQHLVDVTAAKQLGGALSDRTESSSSGLYKAPEAGAYFRD